MDFLAETSWLWLILHLFAMVLGLGGATYSDILLMKFLKDLKISHKEAEVIQTMSRVVLIGIVLAFISGLLLFLPSWERLLQTPKFLLKSVAFIVLVVNGFFLHQIILPQLVGFSFHKDKFLIKKTIHLRHLGFAMGAISVVSWYTVFLLGALPQLPIRFPVLLALYFGILVVAVIAALFLEKTLSDSVKKKKS